MGQEDDLIQKMKERAQAVQTIVSEIDDIRQAFQYTVELTKNQGGTAIAAPGLKEADQSVLGELCGERGVALFTEALRDHIGKIHTGLTLADWGIAETGTLVLDSSSEDIRIATMLSEVHVAVLPKSRIRSDAFALESQLTEVIKSPHRYLAFISGASRTADIERVLTIGVHGPQELHILLFNDDAS